MQSFFIERSDLGADYRRAMIKSSKHLREKLFHAIGPGFTFWRMTLAALTQ